MTASIALRQPHSDWLARIRTIGLGLGGRGVTGLGLGRSAVSAGSTEYTLVLEPEEAAALDTWIFNSHPNTNYATNANLWVGSTNIAERLRSLLRFDLSSIPAAATITAVTLSLYEAAAFGSKTADVHLSRVLRNWIESQATWNVYATGNAWDTAGCSTDGTDRVATPSGSLSMDHIAATAYVSWSSAGMISDVQAWIGGTANYGWLLHCPNKENPLSGSFYNRFNSASAASNRPRLTVIYTA